MLTLSRPPATRFLAAPGAILLVSCYELGHQPLSLASPAAVLGAAGFEPALNDTAVDPLDEVAASVARLVAIAVPMHTALRLGVRIAARIRLLNPGAHICFYGLYASLNALYLLEAGGNSVISGEYERPLLDLAHALDRGDSGPIPGVGTLSALAAPVLERAPFVTPVRTALPPLRRYAGLEREGVIIPAGYVEATRGCHHTCRHCPLTPIYAGRFFVVPREMVLADITAQIEAGARHITFGDPDFFNGPGHGLRICRDLHAAFPGVSFDVTIKVEHLLQHRRLLPELAELGCAFIVTAVESLNDDVLRALAKGHRREDVVEALAALDNVGVPMRPSLLPFSPWETLASYQALLHFVAEQDLIHHIDPVHFSIRLLVPPGSALLAEPESAAWAGELDAPAFTFRWRHPDPRMDALQRTISGLVETAAAAAESADVTFALIWAAAHLAAGNQPPAPPAPLFHRRPPPRLTESWFC